METQGHHDLLGVLGLGVPELLRLATNISSICILFLWAIATDVLSVNLSI